VRAPGPADEEALDGVLSRPSDATVDALRRCPGDVLLLGAGGKMGPTLARMLRASADRLGDGRRVIAVSRFSSADAERSLRVHGVDTVRCDLGDRAAVATLPDAPNIFYLAGQKFGTRDAPARTWMANVVVPAIVAERFAGALIVAFSTGNVYPLVPVSGGGAREDAALGPVGEYAASCVGRERIFEHFAAESGARVALIRLNYAIDLRYGVLTDLALKVWQAEPIDLAMGHVNVIWQGDANQRAIECLPHADAPPFIINLAGTETLSVRALARALGDRLGRDPSFRGAEAPDALLSNASRAAELFGPPPTPVETMLDWVAEWVAHARPVLGKPTGFGERRGEF
jgi:hypothetical protein